MTPVTWFLRVKRLWLRDLNEEAVMSEDKLLSEYEIEAAFRMARETMDFFAGPAISLRPGEACGPFCEPAVWGASAKNPLGILRTLR